MKLVCKQKFIKPATQQNNKLYIWQNTILLNLCTETSHATNILISITTMPGLVKQIIWGTYEQGLKKLRDIQQQRLY